MSARSIFAVFFQTKIKSVARAQKDARFLFFYFARSSTRATDRRNFLQPNFHIQALIYI